VSRLRRGDASKRLKDALAESTATGSRDGDVQVRQERTRATYTLAPANEMQRTNGRRVEANRGLHNGVGGVGGGGVGGGAGGGVKGHAVDPGTGHAVDVAYAHFASAQGAETSVAEHRGRRSGPRHVSRGVRQRLHRDVGGAGERGGRRAARVEPSETSHRVEGILARETRRGRDAALDHAKRDRDRVEVIGGVSSSVMTHRGEGLA